MVQKTLTFRWISIWVLVSFLATAVIPPKVYAQALNLPAPGAMVGLTPAYVPILMKGVRVHPENPLLFDFIVDSGKSNFKAESPAFKAESQKLIKYFLASLTIKEEDLWVNLSPYENNRIIPQVLGKTEMGRDMLAQDYILKQLTASLIYPEKDLGKAFWNRIYTKAKEQFGTTDIPVDTFNKVWITSDKAKVFERNNVAYIVGAHLKVMLESDYQAAQAVGVRTGDPVITPAPAAVWRGQGRGASEELAKQVIRDVVIPEIEKEVNEGQNFAMLRQMFYSMILASWYKLALKDALLNQVYSNKDKTSGVLSDDPAVATKIYEQYLQAYKKGVFDYIKEDMDAVTHDPLPRKYFSGGVVDLASKVEVERQSGRLNLTENTQLISSVFLLMVKFSSVLGGRLSLAKHLSLVALMTGLFACQPAVQPPADLFYDLSNSDLITYPIQLAPADATRVFVPFKVDHSADVGGIALNGKLMDLDVAKDGKGVEMKFDPIMVAEFQRGNFTGVEGVILNIVPMVSPLSLLGLDKASVELVSAKG